MNIRFGKILYKNAWVKWEVRERLEKQILEEANSQKEENVNRSSSITR